MLKSEIVTGGVELISQISAEWTSLCDEGGSDEPFLRPEWFSAFVRNFEKVIQLVVVRKNGKLRAVLPMLQKRGTLHHVPVRRLGAAYNLNTPRFDLVHGADEGERTAVVKAVWATLRNSPAWDLMEFRLVRRDSWLGTMVELAECDNYSGGIWPMDGAPFISFPPSVDKQRTIDNFFGSSRKHLRQELNRRLRRLKEAGSVEFVATRVCTPGLMETYFDLESRGWKGREGTAASDDPVVARMHEDFAYELSAKNALVIYELKLDGATIAMSLNISNGRKTVHWKTTYDESFARYSPGNLLFRELVCNSIHEGHYEIDFLSPGTPNKMSWASDEREHVAFYIFNRTLFGHFLSKWKFSVVGGLRGLRSKPAPGLGTAHAQG